MSLLGEPRRLYNLWTDLKLASSCLLKIDRKALPLKPETQADLCGPKGGGRQTSSRAAPGRIEYVIALFLSAAVEDINRSFGVPRGCCFTAERILFHAFVLLFFPASAHLSTTEKRSSGTFEGKEHPHPQSQGVSGTCRKVIYYAAGDIDH